MSEIDRMDRDSYAVCDRHGAVADVVKLGRYRWAVEDYHEGVVAYFRTMRQAIHYAMQL